MAYDEVSQLRGTTAQISNYKGYPAQFVQNTETGKMGVMQGDIAGNIKYLANEEQLTPLATKEELKPLAKDADVLKLIAQSLTPEQKAQVLKNLEGTFLPLSGGTLTGNIVATIEGLFAISNRNEDASKTGSQLILKSPEDGSFELKSYDPNSGSAKTFVGRPDGTLSWMGNDIATFAGVLGGAETRLDTTIRFSNGLMVYYNGFSTGSSGTHVGTYPIPFTKHQPISGACIALSSDGAVANNVPKIVLATSNDYTRYKVSAKRTDTDVVANVYVYFWAFGR